MVTQRSPKRKRSTSRADKGPEFIKDERGRKTAVVLPIRRYRVLLELLEDMHDLAAMAERDDEGTVPWEEVKRQLRADGLLPD